MTPPTPFKCRCSPGAFLPNRCFTSESHCAQLSQQQQLLSSLLHFLRRRPRQLQSLASRLHSCIQWPAARAQRRRLRSYKRWCKSATVFSKKHSHSIVRLTTCEPRSTDPRVCSCGTSTKEQPTAPLLPCCQPLLQKFERCRGARAPSSLAAW